MNKTLIIPHCPDCIRCSNGPAGIEPTTIADCIADPATLMPDPGTAMIILTNGATDEVVHVTETRSGGNITEMGAFDMNACVASASFGHDKDSAIAVTSDAYTSVGMIGPSDRGGCLATWCWCGFGDVVGSSLVLTVSSFGYPENQSFEQAPHNVTAPRRWLLFI